MTGNSNRIFVPIENCFLIKTRVHAKRLHTIHRFITSNNLALRLIGDEMYPKTEGGFVKLLLNLPRLDGHLITNQPQSHVITL